MLEGGEPFDVKWIGFQGIMGMECDNVDIVGIAQPFLNTVYLNWYTVKHERCIVY